MYYNRLLSTDIEIEHFVDNILKISSAPEKRRAINSISSEEKNIIFYKQCTTLKSENHRDYEYRDEIKRQQLREQIQKELIEKKRLKDDNYIKLGKGGAKPVTQIKSEAKAFYIIGPPASGKSTISNIIADRYGAYIIDSDYAKRKLPEYEKTGGATLVHDESVSINEGLLAHCVENRHNIIIPKIGNNIDKICDLAQELNLSGYSTYLISVELDRVKSTQRAYHRYKQTQRYVPLSLVFDLYSNEPTLNYFKIKQRHSDFFKGFAQISTDVERGDSYKLLEHINLDELSGIDWRL